MATLKSSDPAYVLYVDHQGHPAPLSECFHATAARRLSSTVDRVRRPSTVTQVDSAYCPQCLSFHDASSAMTLGYCPNPTCLQCPLCASIVSCRKMDSAFVLACGRCDWNSTLCGLTVETTAGSTAATKEEIVAAAAQMTTLLQEKRTQSKLAVEEHYQSMMVGWEGVVRRGPNSSAATRNSILKAGRRRKEEDNWSVQTLESALQVKQENWKAQVVVGDRPLQRIDLDRELMLDSSLEGRPVEAVALASMVVQSVADLWPLPIPLRARKSRRCRAELADGKPGILLKPKLNPLEGDSSLRTGHGQWWKKDSSAVHSVPRLRVIRHGCRTVDGSTSTQQHAFCLKATNYTLGGVRLSIAASGYQGEPLWDDQPAKNPFLEGLLVETLSNRHVDVFLLTPTDNSLATFQSELAELESAEDSIIDLGIVIAVPDEVVQWDAEKTLEAAPAPTEAPEEGNVVFGSVKVLAAKSGSVWFEFTCVTNYKGETGRFCAIPILLEIEVGNGSWESSLIQANHEEGKKDMVAFDLVIAWPSKQD